MDGRSKEVKRIMIVVNGSIIERHTAPDEAEVVVINAEDWDGDGPNYGAVDKQTHEQHWVSAKLSTPCSSVHMTFGGRCLNCGWVNDLDGMNELAEVPDPLAEVDELYDWDDDETGRTSDE